MGKEIWKPIKGYEELYQVSNLGRVKRFDRKVITKNGVVKPIKAREMKQSKSMGYAYVCLTKDGITKHFRVHRLVAQTFIPNPENKEQVNHKDGNKLNNNVNNLEWCTNQENCIHAWKNNLNHTTEKVRKTASETGKRTGKLLGKPVSQYDLQGNFIKAYESSYEASRQTGIQSTSILFVVNGRKKTAGKYVWKRISKEEFENYKVD